MVSPNSFLRKYCVLLLVTSMSLSFLGCSPSGEERQSVSGTITLGGKPLSGVSIVFTPLESTGRGATALAAEGAFSLDSSRGPTAGSYVVTVDVEPPDLAEFEMLREQRKNPATGSRIPRRYKSPGALEATVVEGGQNRFSFELKH